MATPWLEAPVSGRNVLVLAPHRPKRDPRLGWMADAAQQPLVVHQLGIHPPAEGGVAQGVAVRGGLVLSCPTAPYVPGEALGWQVATRGHAGAQAACGQLLWMERARALRPEQFVHLFGDGLTEDRAVQLHWVLGHILDITASLLRQVGQFRHLDALVAADLPALPAALIAGGVLGLPVVFDAHEYWPEADLGAVACETTYWEELEQDLLRHVAARYTVSPGLAELGQRRYGVPFDVLPNAEPGDHLLAQRLQADAPPCVFLFQGGFARGRGIELLIQAWPRVSAQAHLHLRGPEGGYRDDMIALARRTGLLGLRIFFPPPVDEAELVSAAAQAHVGLVPYEPHGSNHCHCCPNKLSQYMAASLPVLANATSYVREVVQRAGCGQVVDFADTPALVAAVDALTLDAALRSECAGRSRHFFASTFNWDVLSRGFYAQLAELAGDGSARPLQVFGPPGAWRQNQRFTPFGLLPKEGLYRRDSIAVAHVHLLQRVWAMLPGGVRSVLRHLARRMWALLRRR